MNQVINADDIVPPVRKQSATRLGVWLGGDIGSRWRLDFAATASGLPKWAFKVSLQIKLQNGLTVILYVQTCATCSNRMALDAHIPIACNHYGRRDGTRNKSLIDNQIATIYNSAN